MNAILEICINKGNDYMNLPPLYGSIMANVSKHASISRSQYKFYLIARNLKKIHIA